MARLVKAAGDGGLRKIDAGVDGLPLLLASLARDAGDGGLGTG